MARGKRVGTGYEREFKLIMESNGYVCIRAAGSLGIDIVVLHPKRPPMLFEVKSTSESKFYISRSHELKEQFYQMREYAHDGFECYYAVRFVGRSRKSVEQKWRIVKVEPGDENMIVGPEDGVSLSEFLRNI